MGAKKLQGEILRNFLKDFPNMKNKDISLKYGVSISHASTVAAANGVKKSKKHMEKINKQCGIGNRFKKGGVPHNKGKKQNEYIPLETIERLKGKRYKKNHIPKNAKPDWYEGLEVEKGKSYYVIKVPGYRNLIRKHVYLWKLHNGDIPKGYNIVFKDGNTLNCTIENLECISKQENMLRNSNTVKYPKELIPTYAKIAELNKLIKTKENGKD